MIQLLQLGWPVCGSDIAQAQRRGAAMESLRQPESPIAGLDCCRMNQAVRPEMAMPEPSCGNKAILTGQFLVEFLLPGSFRPRSLPATW